MENIEKQLNNSFIEKLISIQRELKAPKNQKNNFGGYYYRSCEDILEAVKPLLVKHNLLLTLSDSIEQIDNRIYVKATATITDGTNTLSVVAYAREEEVKKGMDASQITGASSSYARKYALNGLFLIDDNKDSDTTNTGNVTINGQNSDTKSKELEIYSAFSKLKANWQTLPIEKLENALKYFENTKYFATVKSFYEKRLKNFNQLNTSLTKKDNNELNEDDFKKIEEALGI
ncbi:MAG: ERF family protein [Candidatus Dojkabacteria bacterium]|nr:ERF family protein [Candidatus Dojkabacteria bacterium]